MRKKHSKITRRQPTSTPFRNVLHAADRLLKALDPHTPEHGVLSFLREHAIGPANTKCWEEIKLYLCSLGHGGYKQRVFQMGWLQICRRNGCFICSSHKGYYLPDKSEDFAPYEITTARRIRGEQANLRKAKTLRKLQEKQESALQPRRTYTRTTARRAGANRPTATRSPRKARSKDRRPTQS